MSYLFIERAYAVNSESRAIRLCDLYGFEFHFHLPQFQPQRQLLQTVHPFFV
jgi:hypothetical protein